LLLAWFLIPTLKYINPKVGVLDDIRHYLEVIFPLTALAGIGLTRTIYLISRLQIPFLKQFTQSVTNKPNKKSDDLVTDEYSIVQPQGTMERTPDSAQGRTHSNSLEWATIGAEKSGIKVILAAFLVYLVFQAYSLHPYQTSYYSEWLGGLRGVSNRNLFDVEFWGNSLKEGSAYLNQTAPANSLVWVPMAQQVAREYLRSDIQITQKFNKTADYGMVFNRYSMLKPQFGIDVDFYSILATQKPIHTINRDSSPILFIIPQ
jgi:hypothetical protein